LRLALALMASSELAARERLVMSVPPAPAAPQPKI